MLPKLIVPQSEMLCSRMPPEEDLFEAAVRKADERRSRRSLKYVPISSVWDEVDILPELEKEAIQEFERKYASNVNFALIDYLTTRN